MYLTSPAVENVEDEHVPEIDGNPRTKKYEIFWLAGNLLPLFGQGWLLTAGPLTGINVTFAELA